jgi:CRP-like cAMP-binding protein
MKGGFDQPGDMLRDKALVKRSKDGIPTHSESGSGNRPIYAKEVAMFLPKTDIFKELTQDAVNAISEIAVEESYDRGAVLFSSKDPANHFYILVKGSVQLSIGEESPKEYIVRNLGEAFGWSSVVGNDSYTAAAQCLVPSKVLKINKSDLEKVFDAHERSGRKFYRSLAKQLGQRLMDMHH